VIRVALFLNTGVNDLGLGAADLRGERHDRHRDERHKTREQLHLTRYGHERF